MNRVEILVPVRLVVDYTRHPALCETYDPIQPYEPEHVEVSGVMPAGKDLINSIPENYWDLMIESITYDMGDIEP